MPNVQRSIGSFLSVVVGLVVVACASSSSRAIYFEGAYVGHCDGEEFVEVSNRAPSDVDVYANTSGELFSPNQGTLIGPASRGTTRLSLAGTAIEGRMAGFSARLNGQYIQDVTFRRGCEPRR
jgi:hypothetical protein